MPLDHANLKESPPPKILVDIFKFQVDFQFTFQRHFLPLQYPELRSIVRGWATCHPLSPAMHKFQVCHVSCDHNLVKKFPPKYVFLS